MSILLNKSCSSTYLGYSSLYKANVLTEPHFVANNSNNSSKKRGELIATSTVSRILGYKRKYLSDLETWKQYFQIRNIMGKLLLIIIDPCAQTMQEISKYVAELDKDEAQGIYHEDELSIETEWLKRWDTTFKAIQKNAFKILSIDFLRKIFEHIAKDRCDTRTLDRLTKNIEKSAERKLLKYGTSQSFLGMKLVDRAYVGTKLLKTSIWSLGFGRLACFGYELLAVNFEELRRMGWQKYLIPTKKRFQRALSWTIRRISYYTLQWGCYTLCISYFAAYDYQIPFKNFGCTLGASVAEVVTDSVANVFDGFIV